MGFIKGGGIVYRTIFLYVISFWGFCASCMLLLRRLNLINIFSLERELGYSENLGVAGGFLAFCLIATIGATRLTPKRFFKNFLGGSAVIEMIALIMTSSRAAILAVFFAGLLYK